MSSYQGLTNAQVSENRQQHGANVLTPPKREAAWRLFLRKFNDSSIRILLVAAALSLGISFVHWEFAETIGIIFAIILATGVSFWFEYDAGKKFDVLNQVNDSAAVRTIRNGNVVEIPKNEIVVGDIVLLETGEEVPADGEILESVSLSIDESALTGELMCSKTAEAEKFDKEATYPSNHVMRGTRVLEGHGVIRIFAVGDSTEYGKVAEKSTEEKTIETPLNQQLGKLAKLIGRAGFALAVALFVLLLAKGIFYGNLLSAAPLELAQHILQYLMISVTLIVVAVPEGLPMSVTLSLALNMRRMLKTNNLVRKMHACETMGAATVICTDKTGTLTQNQMCVHEAMFFCTKSGKLEDTIAEGISVNSTAFLDFSNPEKIKTIGNPTEAGLLLWLHAQGVNYLPLRENASVVEQLTFSTERKYMATLVDSPLAKRKVVYVKGAPEVILGKCKNAQMQEGFSPISEVKSEVESRLLGYQNKAMRTLAFAYKFIDENEKIDLRSLSADLTFLGVVAISDPVRSDVPQAVALCLNAGVGVKIVTGDTAGTAKEIGRQIGIWSEADTEQNIITGVDFEALTDEEAFSRVMALKIMCRARPTDKQRLVQLLQKNKAVVAVTGDGTNDAPALNHADVGLSMGTGTSVAKEASDITLLDDSFNSIATAVMWGRSLYQNIQRFILFQLTINVAALLIVLIGSLFGKELPLTVTQMLWVNLIMDTFAAAALASLPPSREVMKSKPRRNSDFIISPAMRRSIFGTGAAFVALLMGLLYYLTPAEGSISRYSLSYFFTAFVMLQFWNMFNAKAYASGKSAFSNLKNSMGFVVVALLIIAGQVLIVSFGGDAFRTTPLTLNDWLVIIGATSAVLWIGEAARWINRLRRR
ncbi:MAG: calcium-translocating P-type ATPase, PMCA-type [Prevotellaceae bacterium]|jgi:Ca2+-transporting ATPase|nr:calcium-translocating P-type ATPase, PMCA-type [Prevotellaceae bacterium]